MSKDITSLSDYEFELEDLIYLKNAKEKRNDHEQEDQETEQIAENEFQKHEHGYVNKIISKREKKAKKKAAANRLPKLDILDLPESIILEEILPKIPLQSLHMNARLVCKSWHNHISSNSLFNANLLSKTQPEYLIQVPIQFQYADQYCKTLSVEMDPNGLDIELKQYVSRRRMGQIRSSCNGLFLMSIPNQKGLLQIVNLVTNRSLTLPKCPSGCMHRSHRCMTSLAYNPNSNVYKAVHVYSFGFGFEILTLGANNQWRRVPAPIIESSELPSCDWEPDLEDPVADPVEINNHISHYDVTSGEYIISMDANEERSRKTFLPKCADKMCHKKCSYCNLGGYLCLLYEVSSSQLDIWILEDYERQVWFKKHSIVSGAIQFRVPNGESGRICLPKWDNLATVGSIRNGEVIIFESRSDCVYLLDTKLMELRKSKKKLKYVLSFVSHKRSFESLNSLLQPARASA